MNGEDAATYVYESMLYDARFETEYAMERDRYASSRGYDSSQYLEDQLGEVIDSITDYIDSTVDKVNEIVEEVNRLESRIEDLEAQLRDQKQLWSSPFVLVRRDQEVEINAKKVKQIQLTDEQFDRLLDKIS